MRELEFKKGFVCPACKKKRVKVTIFGKDENFFATCECCKELDNPVVVVKYLTKDKITSEFIQKHIDQNWTLVQKYFRQR